MLWVRYLWADLCSFLQDIEQIVGLVLHFACQLKNLKPSTQYSVKVRCAVSGKRWGKWSDPQFFTTCKFSWIGFHKHYASILNLELNKPSFYSCPSSDPLVDIWRSIQALPSGRSVIVTWRTVSFNQSRIMIRTKEYHIISSR